jgi:hypothetical protein
LTYRIQPVRTNVNHVGYSCQSLDHRKDVSHRCAEGSALREVSFRTCRPSRRAPH